MHFQIEQSHTMDIQSYSLPASDRIKVYEQMYSSCMNTQSKLSTWIQSNKEKGPPSPLQEGKHHNFIDVMIITYIIVLL